jgi:hypothetical protein
MPIIRTTFDALADEVEHLETHGREVAAIIPVNDALVIVHVKPLASRNVFPGVETR